MPACARAVRQFTFCFLEHEPFASSNSNVDLFWFLWGREGMGDVHMEAGFVESILSFHLYVGSEDWTRVFRLAWQVLPTPDHSHQGIISECWIPTDQPIGCMLKFTLPEECFLMSSPWSTALLAGHDRGCLHRTVRNDDPWYYPRNYLLKLTF